MKHQRLGHKGSPGQLRPIPWKYRSPRDEPGRSLPRSYRALLGLLVIPALLGARAVVPETTWSFGSVSGLISLAVVWALVCASPGLDNGRLAGVHLVALLVPLIGGASGLLGVAQAKLLLVFLIANLSALSGAVALRKAARLARDAGGNRRIAVVGTRIRMTDVVRRLRAHDEAEPHIVGFVRLDDARLRSACPPGECAATGALRELLNRSAVDEVIFTVSLAELESIRKAIRMAVARGLKVHLDVRALDPGLPSAVVGKFGTVPVASYGGSAAGRGQLVAKRLIDLLGAALLLVVLAPVFGAIAWSIARTGDGPILFRQLRVGRGGRTFVCLKFRSMVLDAEMAQARLASASDVRRPVFKLRDDPRVTRVGRFLRRWSLDELPQFVNVLRGEMSLVGPRPPLPTEVAQYEDWQRRRLAVRPGMTGPWQVSGRADTEFDECVRLDLDYVDSWSLGRDLKVLALTPLAVIRGGGAY